MEKEAKNETQFSALPFQLSMNLFSRKRKGNKDPSLESQRIPFPLHLTMQTILQRLRAILPF